MQSKVMKVALTGITVFILAYFLFAPSLFAETQKVSLQNVKGPVEVIPPGATEGNAAIDGAMLGEGDVVRTYDNSSAEIVFEGVGVIYLKPSSTLTITRAVKSGDKTETITTLAKGQIKAQVEKLLNTASKFETRTPVAVAAVRGTTYIVTVTENGQTTTYVADGQVELTSLLNSLSVQIAAGQVSVVDENGNIIDPRNTQNSGEFSGDEDDQLDPDELEEESFDTEKNLQESVVEGDPSNPSPSE